MIFGSDRSPRRGNVRVCVCASVRVIFFKFINLKVFFKASLMHLAPNRLQRIRRILLLISFVSIGNHLDCIHSWWDHRFQNCYTHLWRLVDQRICSNGLELDSQGSMQTLSLWKDTGFLQSPYILKNISWHLAEENSPRRKEKTLNVLNKPVPFLQRENLGIMFECYELCGARKKARIIY